MGHGDGQIYGYLHLPCRVEINRRLGESHTGAAEIASGAEAAR
jgi:hypothetical protein